MKQFPFKKLDAFAGDNASGNPAGMITIDSSSSITAAEMQQIAWELRGFVSEVGFVCRTGVDRLALRYYSAEREVLFCGHATIAILYDLLTTDAQLAALPRIHFDTVNSRLVAANRLEQDNAVFISAPKPIFSRQNLAVADIARALRLPASAILSHLPATRINAGLETLVVPLANLETTLSASPDERQLKQFCEEQGIDIVTIFTEQTARPDTGWRSRVFAPRFGYLEDPATGSGNAALGHYLLRNGLWQGEPLTIEQNSERSRPNIVKLMALDETDGTPRVLFGGGAITRIEGSYCLQ